VCGGLVAAKLTLERVGSDNHFQKRLLYYTYIFSHGRRFWNKKRLDLVCTASPISLPLQPLPLPSTDCYHTYLLAKEIPVPITLTDYYHTIYWLKKLRTYVEFEGSPPSKCCAGQGCSVFIRWVGLAGVGGLQRASPLASPCWLKGTAHSVCKTALCCNVACRREGVQPRRVYMSCRPRRMCPAHLDVWWQPGLLWWIGWKGVQ